MMMAYHFFWQVRAVIDEELKSLLFQAGYITKKTTRNRTENRKPEPETNREQKRESEIMN